MQSFIKFLLLAMLANGAAAQCQICGDTGIITNTDGVLFQLGNNGVCEFVAGNDPSIPLAICPLLIDRIQGTGVGQVTCAEFEEAVFDINDFVCDLFPEQVTSVCACRETGAPSVDPPFASLLQLLIQFFQALFGF